VEVKLTVLGTPAPKGSARAFVVNGRAVVAPGGSATNRKAIKSWEAAVREAAETYTLGRSGPVFVDVPIRVRVSFRLARRAGHWSKKGGVKASAPSLPAVKPDLDKLVRATMDALEGAVFADDSRIVALSAVKVYALPGQEGATIVVTDDLVAPA
jgi:Holliday junction resolvase RusA-like endonuclease